MQDTMIKPGSIILFKGKGFLYEILSRLIKMKHPEWDRWGWHMALVVDYHKSYGWMLAEAMADGVGYGWLKQKSSKWRVVNWCGDVPAIEVRRFAADRMGCKYDVMAYIWTALQEIMPWFPRIVNNRYTCWELVYEFCREMGCAVQKPHKYPVITDIVKGDAHV